MKQLRKGQRLSKFGVYNLCWYEVCVTWFCNNDIKSAYHIDLDFESSSMATYYKKLVYTAILAEDLYQSHISSGIFPSTFLQPLNGSKSILNWVMKLNLFLCFFIFLFLKHPWKIFLSIHLFLTLWFRYLQTLIKEKCMYLSS